MLQKEISVGSKYQTIALAKTNAKSLYKKVNR